MKSLTLLISLLFTSFSWAQSYQLGNVQFSGDGCPAQSSSVSLSPDLSSISVLFSQFRVGQIQGQINKRMAKCFIKIPITTSPGFVLEATSIDYRGFANLPANTSARIATAGVIAAQLGGKITPSTGVMTDLSGPITDIYTISQNVPQSLAKAKHCGQTSVIHLDISAIITSRTIANTDFMIDSADLGIDSGLTLGVRLRACR